MNLEHATETTFVKVLSRILAPVVTLLLAVSGFFVVRMLDDIRANQEAQSRRIEVQADKIQLIDSKVTETNAQLRFGVMVQVEDLRNRLDALELAAAKARSE